MAVLSPKRQVTLPKELCDRLDLAPGDDLDLVEHEGRILIIKRARGRSAGVLKHLKADVRITEDESRDSAIAEAHGGPKSARLSSPTIGAAPLGGPGLRTFFRIAQAWNLDDAQQRRLLGDPPPSIFDRWQRNGGVLSRDALERISHVLAIFKALSILFPIEAQANAWIRKPNSASPFGGRSALDRMLSGNVSDLFVVRSYLKGQFG